MDGCSVDDDRRDEITSRSMKGVLYLRCVDCAILFLFIIARLVLTLVFFDTKGGRGLAGGWMNWMVGGPERGLMQAAVIYAPGRG